VNLATNPELELDGQPLSGKLTLCFAAAGVSVEFRVPAGGTATVTLTNGVR